MRNNIKPLFCPFCGCVPEIWQASWTGFWRIGCQNQKCLIQPRTPADIGDYLEKTGRKQSISEKVLKREIIKFWNKRI